MLYATTRGKHDVVTAYKTIHTDCYVDGGLFLPFRMPLLNQEQIKAMGLSAPAQTVANVLNKLFSTSLTAWDVEVAIGRHPIGMVSIGRRLTAGELWKNRGQDVSHMVQALSDRVGGREQPTNWVEIAVRIALLFAAYGMLLRNNGLQGWEKLDLAVTTGDFSTPIAAWYAREMGLPIGNILCGCNANGTFWDLMNRGEFASGDMVLPTSTPEADVVVPRNLERLIHGIFGVEENRRYLSQCRQGRNYTLSEEQLNQLKHEMFVAVVSNDRVASILPGVYGTTEYVLSPYAALAYGSLLDFRAISGEENPTLLVAERSPAKDRELVNRLIGVRRPEVPSVQNR